MKAMNFIFRLIFLIILIFLLVTIIRNCNNSWKRKDPTTVGYREKVKDTDCFEIWKTSKYQLVKVDTDTVFKRTKSTLDIPKVENVDKYRVDLNDYLGSPNDNTDWNYTEISEEEQNYLDNLGVYYDDSKGYWRIKK